MKRAFIGLAVMFLLPTALLSQNGESRGLGYGFFAPGFTSPGNAGIVHVGGGGEAFIKGTGVGVGAELGFMGNRQYFSEAFGVLSANGSYHFPTTGRLVPFATGGYTVFFRGGSANLFNVGGGFDTWLGRRGGLRFEVRDHVLNEYGTVHYVSIRIGFVAR